MVHWAEQPPKLLHGDPQKMLPSGDLQEELPVALTTPQDGSRESDAGLSDVCLRITAGGSFPRCWLLAGRVSPCRLQETFSAHF